MEAELARYLARRLEGATDIVISGLSRIPGGASRETWRFDAAWQADGVPQSEGFIVRKDPPASLVESDRAVEYAFYSAFDGTSVPVPRMCWLEEESTHLGAPFFIMERIDGCDTNTRALQTPAFDACREGLARRFYAILAEIGRLPWQDSPIAAVMDAPAPPDCWRRELGYWEGMIDANELSPQPIARAAIRWLRANPPPPPAHVGPVHGDYRVGNFLYTREGEIRGILDWEMAHLGDPIEDLAWSFMELWEWGRSGYPGGIVLPEDAIRYYQEASGTTVDREALHWWLVFNCVKGQGIWLTGARSFQEGRSRELIHAYTSHNLINTQDEAILRAMGRGA